MNHKQKKHEEKELHMVKLLKTSDRKNRKNNPRKEKDGGIRMKIRIMIDVSLEAIQPGTTWWVQWLRLHASSAGMWIHPDEQRKIPHAVQHDSKKKKKRSNLEENELDFNMLKWKKTEQ